MMKVSCILTSYNRTNFLRQAIESVTTQTYPYWELFIVDDNSNQETVDIILEFVNKDSRIHLLQSHVKPEDRGKTTRYATCINMAIPKLTGNLVTYLTDDDYYFPQRFEKMVEVFESSPHIHVLYGKQHLSGLFGDVWIYFTIRELVGITREPQNKIDHNSIMHRRSCFIEVPYWNDEPDNWMNADAKFFQNLAKHWDFHPLDFVTDAHRFHDDSVQGKLNHGKKPHLGNTE